MGRGIRVYGERGSGSFKQVTEGIMEAAAAKGLLEGFMRCDVLDPEQDPEGSDADVSVSLGSAAHLILTHTTGIHKRRWFMLAPNSEGIPWAFIDAILAEVKGIHGRRLIDGLLVPSRWAAEVVGASDGLPADFPMMVAPHGVGKHFRVIDRNRQTVRGQFNAGSFNVLHITNTYTGRKGTPQLVHAWRALQTGPWSDHRARLAIAAHPRFLADYRYLAEEAGGESIGITVHPGLSLGDKEMGEAYSFAHVVCQPSRAEGFGLVPLEALACGVPVVATACTGHSEYIPLCSGTVVVEHGPSAPSDDFSGAMAPTVTTEAIFEALKSARERWEDLDKEASAQADGLAERWSWTNTTGPVLEAAVREAERESG